MWLRGLPYRGSVRALSIPALALLLAATTGCAPGGGEDEGFKLIHVADLVTQLGSGKNAPTVLDANGADFRAKEGVIAGATLLSSYKAYDVAKELPARKDAPLVFYCADSH